MSVDLSQPLTALLIHRLAAVQLVQQASTRAIFLMLISDITIEDVTATSGPNGNIDWLNCGVTGSGWTPPLIRVSQVIAANLTKAAQNPQSAFTSCQQFIPLFEQYGKQMDGTSRSHSDTMKPFNALPFSVVPAIFLASFAMQESSCNPNAVGGAGEQGLMQLTKDKCTDAPGGNCKDPVSQSCVALEDFILCLSRSLQNYNIMTGAKYFADTLNGNDGNLLLTIGGYNGWPRGLTVVCFIFVLVYSTIPFLTEFVKGEATAAAHSSCCRCQNNLD